ncbi:PDZ domain-containing protein [Luteolibacter ambystomatis]|uniref:PDZ domain-containing protein n=1 Tax=Luteolibacter ambystomatis TaxID=2824561 RepID=A0A975G9H9_9BACT|nr:PDZ domain-containing protein [Luteolibacter ambystomatis]QUE50815.1 PDZ domain-containing protein [Luteolibacter ambystomatis]
MLRHAFYLLPCVAGLVPVTATAKTDPQIEASVQSVYPALVRIHVVAEEGGAGRMQKMRASGSGTIIHPDGYILTNHHVAGRATRIVVRLSDRQEVRATLVGTDPLADLAILKIDKKDLRDPNAPLPVAKFGDSATLEVGDVVLAMGSPAGLSQSVTQGIVANTEMIAPGGSMRLDGEAVGELVRWIGHDAVIFPGNSGGPLVNLKGEIIGVNEVGIGSLGGAIPANLARKVADELIATGKVRRSWAGLIAQPLLKTSKETAGILVGGVIEGSPAEKAGLKAGDIITVCNGAPVPASRAPEDIPVFNRQLLESPVGSEVKLGGLRDGKAIEWKLITTEREPAEPREKELLSWGITARDLTQLMAKGLLRADNKAAVVQSVRAGGAAADSKPAIVPGDLILGMDDKPVTNLADLVDVSAAITKDKTEPVPVLVSYEHDGRNYLTVVKIGPEPDPDKPGLVRKAWIGVDTQVISADLASALGIQGSKGVRITQIHPGSNAEKAGLKTGDLLLKLDGTVIPSSRPEDSDVFNSLIRQYKIGSEISLNVRRGKEDIVIKVPLIASPEGTSELASHTSDPLEFTARDLGQADRVREKLPDDLKGVLVTAVTPSGWAGLAGLSNEDILLSLDGKPVESIATLKTILDDVEKNKRTPFVLFVRRGITTRYIELEPTW